MKHIFKNDVYCFKSLNNVTRKPVYEGSQAHAGFVVDKVTVGDVCFPSVLILLFLDNFTKVLH
jgi:hypothetical protein